MEHQSLVVHLMGPLKGPTHLLAGHPRNSQLLRGWEGPGEGLKPFDSYYWIITVTPWFLKNWPTWIWYGLKTHAFHLLPLDPGSSRSSWVRTAAFSAKTNRALLTSRFGAIGWADFYHWDTQWYLFGAGVGWQTSTLPQTNTSPVKIGRNLIGKDRLPWPLSFRGNLAISQRGNGSFPRNRRFAKLKCRYQPQKTMDCQSTMVKSLAFLDALQSHGHKKTWWCFVG